MFDSLERFKKKLIQKRTNIENQNTKKRRWSQNSMKLKGPIQNRNSVKKKELKVKFD